MRIGKGSVGLGEEDTGQRLDAAATSGIELMPHVLALLAHQTWDDEEPLAASSLQIIVTPVRHGDCAWRSLRQFDGQRTTRIRKNQRISKSMVSFAQLAIGCASRTNTCLAFNNY